MSTIYELEKQATPGPVYVSDGENNDGSVWCGDGELVCLCDLRSGILGTMPRAIGNEEKSNAKLIAHCLNNFMKALEALKQEHEYASQAASEAYGITHGAHKCVTCKLIKELETIHTNK